VRKGVRGRKKEKWREWERGSEARKERKVESAPPKMPIRTAPPAMRKVPARARKVSCASGKDEDGRKRTHDQVQSKRISENDPRKEGIPQ
jgi:hypothetical protein